MTEPSNADAPYTGNRWTTTWENLDYGRWLATPAEGPEAGETFGAGATAREAVRNLTGGGRLAFAIRLQTDVERPPGKPDFPLASHPGPSSAVRAADS